MIAEALGFVVVIGIVTAIACGVALVVKKLEEKGK
jgi:hypothetical protein